MEESTICLICEDDYGEIAEECFLGGVCPDCIDNADVLEDLVEAVLQQQQR